MYNKKIFIIGFGSIGQRHYRNLVKLGYRNVFVYDSNKKQYQDKKINLVSKVTPKILADFGVVFVCTPDHAHLKYALMAAKAGCDIFIEKPLSDSLKGIKNLIDVCRQKQIISMVGCNMRFHPCLQYIKKYLDRGKLGKLYSIRFEFGHYLPSWRPGEDYRKIYKSGIILNDIHEFDLLFWFTNFSKIKESNFIFDTVSKLKGVGEDQSIASFKFTNKVFGLVQSDYLQQSYNRNCKIIGEKGNLSWDFKDNVVWFESAKGQIKIFEVKKFDFNKVYVEQLNYFISCLKNRQDSFNNVERASEVLDQVI